MKMNIQGIVHTASTLPLQTEAAHIAAEGVGTLAGREVTTASWSWLVDKVFPFVQPIGLCFYWVAIFFILYGNGIQRCIPKIWSYTGDRYHMAKWEIIATAKLVMDIAIVPLFVTYRIATILLEFGKELPSGMVHFVQEYGAAIGNAMQAALWVAVASRIVKLSHDIRQIVTPRRLIKQLEGGKEQDIDLRIFGLERDAEGNIVDAKMDGLVRGLLKLRLHNEQLYFDSGETILQTRQKAKAYFAAVAASTGEQEALKADLIAELKAERAEGIIQLTATIIQLSGALANAVGAFPLFCFLTGWGMALQYHNTLPKIEICGYKVFNNPLVNLGIWVGRGISPVVGAVVAYPFLALEEFFTRLDDFAGRYLAEEELQLVAASPESP